MSDSIYNINKHESTESYSLNDIVYERVNIGGSNTGVPKELKYYYALKDVPTGQPLPTITQGSTAYWGGYTSMIGNDKTIPEFLWTPSYNLSASHNPRVNTVVFGNGYEQRNKDGIYTGLIRLDVSFQMRNQKEGRAIIQFLKARKGSESFAVKNLPPIYSDSGYTKRFICPNFNSNFTFHNNYDVKTSFIETNN